MFLKVGFGLLSNIRKNTTNGVTEAAAMVKWFFTIYIKEHIVLLIDAVVSHQEIKVANTSSYDTKYMTSQTYGSTS